MSPFTLFGFPPSTYTQTARLVAAEAGAGATLQPLEFKQPSHFAKHPYGKMPALEHGELRLFETLAIASYIDRVAGDGALQPEAPAAHARMLQWISAAVDYAYEDLVNGLHDDNPSAEAVTAAGQQLELLDRGLGEAPFFAGDALSLADLFVYPMVEFALGKLGSDAPRGLPALNRWRASVAARPATQEVMS